MNIQPEQLTLFQPGILNDLANPLVLPGTEEARKMTVTSGRKLLDFYKNSDPVGLSVRMFMGTSLWASTMCYLNWKASVTPHKHLLFRLVPSTPRTEETGSSFWPTPAAQDGKNSTLPISQIDRDTIPGAVMRSMWPTPTASQDYKPIRPLAPSEANGSHGTMLVGAVGHTEPESIGGSLNPDWVEALQGFPSGWTELD